MKRCSISLIIREIQIKTTVRYHLTLVRMAIIKNSTNNTCCRDCGGKGTPLYCLWESEEVQSLWKATWRFLRKLKIELPYDKASLLLDMYPDECVCLCVCQSLSRIQFFATPQIIAHQDFLSMEFSRQKYWSGLPFPSLIQIKL